MSGIISSIASATFSSKLLQRRDLAECIQIKVCYDIEHIKKIVLQVIAKNQTYEKDQIAGYNGLSLQYAESSNIYNAGVSRTDKYNMPNAFRYFDKFNDLGKEFAFIHNTFSKISLVRGRILIAGPGAELPWHTDWPMGWRLHLPITTHMDATIDFKDKSYHLPADGNCYLINGNLEHRMRNASSVSRIHIVYEVMTYESFNALKTHSLDLLSSLSHD